MSITVAAIAVAGDTDSHTTAAIVAVTSATAGAAAAQHQSAVAAAAVAGDTDSDTAAAIAAVSSATAVAAAAQHQSAIAAAAIAGDTASDTAAAIVAITAATAGAAFIAGVPVMFIPGSIDGSNTRVEATSLARAMEDGAVGVTRPEKDAKAGRHGWHNNFVAVATGPINYLQSSVDLNIAAESLGTGGGKVPATVKTLTKAVK